MNNNDERDFAEEAYNAKTLATGDGEIDDGPQHWLYGGPQGVAKPVSRQEWGAEREWENKLMGRPVRTFPYYFLFGFGHKLIAALNDSMYRPNPNRQVGFPLSGYYVKIDATDEMVAREMFVKQWGEGNFSSVHDQMSFERLCAKHHYKELKFP